MKIYIVMYKTEGHNRFAGAFLNRAYAEQAANMIKNLYRDNSAYKDLVYIIESESNDFDIKKCKHHIENDVDYRWHVDNCFDTNCPCDCWSEEE